MTPYAPAPELPDENYPFLLTTGLVLYPTSILLLLLVNYFLRKTRYAFPRGELLFIFFFVTEA